MGEHRHHVETERVKQNIRVVVFYDGLEQRRLSTTVRPYTTLEKLFGTTFERRVQQAKDNAQRRCDKLNAQVERAKGMIGRIEV